MSGPAPKKKRGGARPGPNPGDNRRGRFTQSTALARVEAHRIASSSHAPLKIMIENMMFWHDSAKNLEHMIIDLMQKITDDSLAPTQGETKSELMDKANDLVRNFTEARKNSQHCAAEAAPYVHPRLKAVIHKVNNDASPTKIAESAPEEKFVDAYAQLVIQSYTTSRDPTLEDVIMPEVLDDDDEED